MNLQFSWKNWGRTMAFPRIFFLLPLRTFGSSLILWEQQSPAQRTPYDNWWGFRATFDTRTILHCIHTYTLESPLYHWVESSTRAFAQIIHPCIWIIIIAKGIKDNFSSKRTPSLSLTKKEKKRKPNPYMNHEQCPNAPVSVNKVLNQTPIQLYEQNKLMKVV
jgi:hypothetical protein